MVKLRRPFLLPTAVAFLAVALMTGEVEAGSLSGENGLEWAAAWSACDGTIGECLGGKEAEEMAMDSESNRRILQGTANYIVYNPGLSPDRTICRIPGALYNDCRPARVLQPFQNRAKRGCYGPCNRKPPPALQTDVRD